MQNDLWTKSFSRGHGKIREAITNGIFDIPRDRMKPEINFVRHFEAVIPSISDWLDSWPNCLPGDGLISFTDGSRTSNGTGAGVFVWNREERDRTTLAVSLVFCKRKPMRR